MSVHTSPFVFSTFSPSNINMATHITNTGEVCMNRICNMCGKESQDRVLDSHHTLPVYMEGSEEDIIDVCQKCHGKADYNTLVLLLEPYFENFPIKKGIWIWSGWWPRLFLSPHTPKDEWEQPIKYLNKVKHKEYEKSRYHQHLFSLTGKGFHHAIRVTINMKTSKVYVTKTLQFPKKRNRTEYQRRWYRANKMSEL